MPFLNFGGNKHFNLSDMNFFMKNMKIRYSDPDPPWNRIHFGTGSGSTFSKFGSEDPDPLLRKGGSEDPDPLSQMWIPGSGFTAK